VPNPFPPTFLKRTLALGAKLLNNMKSGYEDCSCRAPTARGAWIVEHFVVRVAKTVVEMVCRVPYYIGVTRRNSSPEKIGAVWLGIGVTSLREVFEYPPPSTYSFLTICLELCCRDSQDGCAGISCIPHGSQCCSSMFPIVIPSCTIMD
jgi:hypothetical protein